MPQLQLALLRAGMCATGPESMTADAASARRLAERAPDRLFVMDKWRYHPGVEAMRREARSGRLGRVLTIRTSRC